MAEQQRAEQRDIAEAGNGKLGQVLDRNADEARADHGRQADAEDRQREAGRDLIREQRKREDAEGERHQHAGERAGDDAERAAAGGDGDRESGHGARQHHALDAEVEDARFFHDELAERGVEQRRRGADDGDQHQRGGIQVHAGATSRRSLIQRTR